MAKAKPNAPADKVALYDALIDTNSQVVRKGAANAYTSLNGHMFSFLDKTGALSLRLGKEDRDAFLVEFDTVSKTSSIGASTVVETLTRAINVFYFFFAAGFFVGFGLSDPT